MIMGRKKSQRRKGTHVIKKENVYRRVFELLGA